MSPLSELVWSPDEGLSIKIAASSLSTRKASLRWNADTLNIVISSPQQSGGGGKSGDNVDATLGDAEKMPSQLRTRNDSSVRVSMASPTRIRNLDAQESTSIRSHRQDSKCCGGKNVTNKGKIDPDNCSVDRLEKEEEVRSCPTRFCKDGSDSNTPCLGSASRKETMPTIAEKQVFCATSVHKERSWAPGSWRARLIKAITQRDSVLPKNADSAHSPSSFGNLGDAGNIPGRLTGFLGDKNDNCQDQVMQDIHKDGPNVATYESASGADPVTRCESASGVNPVARNESTSGVNPSKLEKGKEKVLYDISNCVSNTNEGDDSNESIESCPSREAPKRKHAQYSRTEMPSQNKRFRREDNESSCSGLFDTKGSSFFNWMSSLTNGLTKFDETTPAVPLNQKFSAATGEETAAHHVQLRNNSSVPLQSVGFNSLFQSLYSHNVMITSRNTSHKLESNYTERIPNRITLALKGREETGKGRETLVGAMETLAPDSIQMGSDGDRGKSSKSLCGSPEEQQNEFHGRPSSVAMGHKGGFAESLWVSRLLPKTTMNLNATQFNDKLDSSSLQNINVDTQCFASKGSGNEATSSKCPEMPPEEHKPSQKIASVFAKRLDALRHAKTSAVRLNVTCDPEMSKGHNHRTSSFAVSSSSHDELQAGQENHKSSSTDGKLVLWIGEKGKEQLFTGSDEELREKVLSEREHRNCEWNSAGKVVASHGNLEANSSAEDIDGRGVYIKEGASNSLESLPDNKQIVPYGIMPNDACDESRIVFGALQRLRLSRLDIIRWLKSPIVHTNLDGFFLRLRFGKWEEALGGTGYHVARINGALDRNRLSVTIRNSTCQVDSRFVSNHDFHEDELKAWWSAAMKGSWKLPSKEELDTKLRERELLRL